MSWYLPNLPYICPEYIKWENKLLLRECSQNIDRKNRGIGICILFLVHFMSPVANMSVVVYSFLSYMYLHDVCQECAKVWGGEMICLVMFTGGNDISNHKVFEPFIIFIFYFISLEHIICRDHTLYQHSVFLCYCNTLLGLSWVFFIWNFASMIST